MEHITMHQTAVGNYTYPLYPFLYFLESMLRLGVENIEIWAAGPHLYLGDFDFGMLKEMGTEIRSRGLNPVCLTPEQCAYPVNIGAKEPYIRKRSMSYFKKAIDSAEILEIPAVLVTPGNGYRNEGHADTWKYTVENLRELSDYAQKKGITLYLEHLTKETTNIAVRAEELVNLKDAAGRKNLVCMADTDMMSRYGETIKDYLDAAHGQIGHVHFVDGMPGGHLALGDGVLPLYDYLDTLDKNRYGGYLTLEILNDRYYLEPENAVKKSLDWLRQYLEE